MKSMLHIGASKKAIEAAREAILAILGAGRGDKVTGKALDAFRLVCEIRNTSITGCTFTATAGSPDGIVMSENTIGQ